MIAKGGYCSVDLTGLTFNNGTLDRSGTLVFPGLNDMLSKMIMTGKPVFGENITNIRNGASCITATLLVCSFDSSTDNIRVTLPYIASKVCHLSNDTITDA